MYSRILVPLDSSDFAEQVLPMVTVLGKTLQPTVELLAVIQEFPEEVASSTGINRGEVTASWTMQAQNYLGQISAALQRQGLDTSSTVSQGDIASCILDEAARDPATLIAMSTHGWEGSARWNLGSVTLKILQGTGNPVLVVRAQKNEELHDELHDETHLENIIVPLDGSSVSEEAIPHAMTFARAYSAKITLLRVTPSGWDYYNRTDHGILHAGDLSKATRDQATEYLNTVADRLSKPGILTLEQKVEQGEPGGAIIDLAEQTPHSLVTMVTLGQGSYGRRRWAMGSVAQRVAGGCRAPVLVIPAMKTEPGQ